MHEEIAHSDPVRMTQDICDGLETMVRRHMGQWFWIHRRWKGGKPRVSGSAPPAGG